MAHSRPQTLIKADVRYGVISDRAISRQCQTFSDLQPKADIQHRVLNAWTKHNDRAARLIASRNAYR